MQDNTQLLPPDYNNSPEKQSFILAEQGTLEIIELMSAADRLKSAGLKDQTISLYQLWLEHATSPLKYVGYFNLGVELSSGRDYLQSEAMYRKALELSPDFVRARLNMGNCLEQQKRDDEALEQWRIALKSESILLPENLPLQLHAYNNLGRLLEMKKNYQESLVMLEKSFSLDPTQRDVLLHLVHLIQKVCRWPIYVPPKGITKQEMINGTSPLAMLAASDDPKLQLAAARQFVEHKYPITSTVSLAPKCGYKHDKIRIGYLSSDFCLHAVSLLTVELLELHNHDQFEVYGFCWSRVDDTSIQKRVIKAMDHYIKIGEMSDKEAAECIRSHEIDIMIDLQGLTSGARPMILSYRPATLQMTYLGFPGTTGLPWIDYVIADKYLIPYELVPFHTEKPLYMPNCFQSSDSKREVGTMPTRADNGLPEKAFVFCSFNNNYKFTPELFAVWMRIIKRVPGSVFWLLADNEWAKENLIKAAKKQGIKKDRLIFATRVAPADYLARYQLADLFLDTFPFNGGTTANDALFMGLPLLTLSGRTFASRMAGSLLTNLGLPELITTSLREYEEKAVRLAKKPAELMLLKSRLLENKKSGPMFNTAQLVSEMEIEFSRLVTKNPEYQSIDGKRVTKGAGKSSMPLVSILIPTHNRPDYFELALNSALAQDYDNIEVIVSDNSDDELTSERIEPYLKKYPYICYSRVPGFEVLDNFNNCLALAEGEYINYLMDDDLFHPQKIKKMMAYMLTQTNVGMVTSFRQLIDGEGKYMAPLPGTERLFETETLIRSTSLGETILLKGNNIIGEPTTVLFRRADIGKRFGEFVDKEYSTLADVATWLSILVHRDCVYLPEPLSFFRIHGGQDHHAKAIKLKACVDWLQLFCDAHEHNKFLPDRSAIHELLTSKLVTSMWYMSSEHEKIKDGAYELEKIHAVIRQATTILLGK